MNPKEEEGQIVFDLLPVPAGHDELVAMGVHADGEQHGALKGFLFVSLNKKQAAHLVGKGRLLSGADNGLDHLI